MNLELSASNEKNGVRALSRGLEVLVAVNEATPASVSQVVAATGLAKATVVRLLKSLCEDGYLVAIETGGYRPLPKVRRLASAMIAEDPFLSEVKRMLKEFGRVSKWPSDYLVADVDAMLIVASNRESAPISLARYEHRRFSLLDSAAGNAFLSAMGRREREAIVDSVLARTGRNSEGGLTRIQILDRLQQISDQGYSIKDYSAPLEEVRVYAVPVTVKGKVIGALALVVIRDLVPEENFEQNFLPALKAQVQMFEDVRLHGPTQNRS